MTCLRFGLPLLLVLCVGPLALAAEPDSKANQAMDKTDRLEFKLTPVEGDDPVLFTYCAEEEYEVGFGYRNLDIDFDIGVAGAVRPVSDGRYLVTYNAKMVYIDENEGEEAQFDIKGSTLVTVGKPKGIGALDERTLTVVLTEEDE